MVGKIKTAQKAKNFVKVCMNCGSSDWNYLIEDARAFYPRGVGGTTSQYTINCRNCGHIGTWVEMTPEGQKELQNNFEKNKK